MKQLLLVDDDALVMRSYRDRLSAHGFHVNTAASGSAAIAILRSARPDLVVLDLMMPDLSGVDVLRFIRSEPRLAATPVVVLTNTYMNDLGMQAAAIGIEKALLKAQCSPSALMASIDEILQHKPAPSAPAQMPAAPTASLSTPLAATPPTVQPTQSEASAPQPTRAQAFAAAPSAHAEAQTADQTATAKPGAKASTDLLTHAPTICAELRKLFQVLAKLPPNRPEQQMRLQQLYRKVHSLAGSAGQTEYAQLEKTATVFEALLYVLMDDPARIGPSVLRTLASLVDFVELLFRHAGQSRADTPFSVQVLVVDDDPLSNRLMDSALRKAQFNPRSTEDPLVAWQWAHHEHFDLILLDVEMPVLNGFELCERLRTVPGYEKTPVIFVTVHSDFESRAKSSLSGGNDLIAKPILPMELAAKAVMHLLKSQMPA